MRRKILGIGLALFIVAGCSKGAEEATQKVIDYGTGKTQLDTYQNLRKEIKAMNDQNSRQFEE